jgi:hypothetical protein
VPAITSIHAFGLLFAFVVGVLPIVPVYKIAERKGRPGWVYVVACLIVGWPIPLLAALLVRRRAPGMSVPPA